METFAPVKFCFSKKCNIKQEELFLYVLKSNRKVKIVVLND